MCNDGASWLGGFSWAAGVYCDGDGDEGGERARRNRALRDKEGDGGDGNEKEGECLVAWGFIRIFAAPFAAKNGCNGNKRGGHRWALTETKEGGHRWLLTRHKEDAIKSRLTRKGMQRWVWMVLTGQ